MVYDHPREAFLLHHVCSRRSKYGLQSFKECVFPYTARAAISLLNTGYNHSRDTVLLHRLCSGWSAIYWFTGYGLQLPKGRSYEFPGAETQAIHLAGVGFATEIASYWDNKLLR